MIFFACEAQKTDKQTWLGWRWKGADRVRCLFVYIVYIV